MGGAPDQLRRAGGRRLGQTFGLMLQKCPKSVAAYAACVRGKIQDQTLERGACAAEFAELRRCFVAVQAELRAKR